MGNREKKDKKRERRNSEQKKKNGETINQGEKHLQEKKSGEVFYRGD